MAADDFGDLPDRHALEAGITVWRLTFERWVDKASDQDWRSLVRESLEELKVLVS
jgi:hypothetical protein